MAIKNYDIVRDVYELERLFDKLTSDALPIGFDVETGYYGPDIAGGSLRVETNLLVGFSFTNSLDWARYVPLAHDLGENIKDTAKVAELLWKLVQTGLLVCHNLAFELRNLSRFFREQLSDHPLFGQSVREARGYFPYRSDTMVETYIERNAREFGLKELTFNIFGHRMIKIEDLFPSFTDKPGLTDKQKKCLRFNVLDLTPQVITYACEDALWCLAIHLKTYPKVSDQFMYKVDMQLVRVLCDMEEHGIEFDWAFLREYLLLAQDFLVKMNDEIQADLTEMMRAVEPDHPEININLKSPPQLSKVLFEKLGMKTRIMTTSTKSKPKGEQKMSTGAVALEGLAKEYAIVRKILDYKNLSRLINSFLEKYERDFDYAPDGRVHPTLQQAFVRTGRFSASKPNYQQLPAINLKDDDGSPLSYNYKLRSGETFKMNFRNAITAPKDYYIIGFDFSQAEYRAAAGEANERSLIEAFENGEDVHTKVASMMFKVPMEDVNKELRSKAKTLGFGLLYGMDAKGLASRLGISVGEARELFEKYFAAFPSLAMWTQRQVQFGYDNGFVTTKFGRKIPIWELADDRKWVRESGERACYNYPVQGGATGDYVRICMVRAWRAIQKSGLGDKIKLVMNVHDALEFYVHRSISPKTVIDLLTPEIILPVPGWPGMVADWHIGTKWGSVKEIEFLDDGRIKIKDGPVLA